MCLEEGTGWRVVVGSLESIYHDVIYNHFNVITKAFSFYDFNVEFVKLNFLKNHYHIIEFTVSPIKLCLEERC